MKWDELSFVGGGLSPRRPTAGHVIQLWRVTAGNAPAAGRLEHSNILGGRGAENGLPTANDAEVQAVSHFCQASLLVDFKRGDVERVDLDGVIARQLRNEVFVGLLRLCQPGCLRPFRDGGEVIVERAGVAAVEAAQGGSLDFVKHAPDGPLVRAPWTNQPTPTMSTTSTPSPTMRFMRRLQ